MEQKKSMRLSVRQLVEYCMRSGDIRSGGFFSLTEGVKAHKEIESLGGPDYQKEVSLKLDVSIAGIVVELIGRADGIIHKGTQIIIDEIKSSYYDLSLQADKKDRHYAQALCYAYMYLSSLEQKERDCGATLQLTYKKHQSDKIIRETQVLSFREIEERFNALILEYEKHLRLIIKFCEQREQSAKKLPFPYKTYRAGQREMAIAVYSAIEKKKKLYAQAPTGIGKTISALYPAVKAMGESKASRIFYLTARNINRQVAQSAVELMCDCGLSIKSITLRSKEKLCPNDVIDCRPETCPRAKGHYDRVRGAVFELIENNSIIGPAEIENVAGEHDVCPYEMMLDLIEYADIVIGDYNHAFDPLSKLERAFSDKSGQNVFLIDEAHNLFDRAREMYSVSFTASHLSESIKSLDARKKRDKLIKRALNELYRMIKGYTHDGVISDQDANQALNLCIEGLSLLLEEYFLSDPDANHSVELLQFYFDALFYMQLRELPCEHFKLIAETEHGAISYFCLNPAPFIEKSLSKAKAAIFFSATLNPLTYYRDILGGDEQSGIISLPSPFDPCKLKISVNSTISTKYADRQSSIEPVRDAIYEAITDQSGNYIAYLPSYQYMGDIYRSFIEAYPDINTITEKRAMGEPEKEAFLRTFTQNRLETLLGFCVIGASFSEAVDLVGDSLNGVIIVGVGLPKLSLKRELIKNYFIQAGKPGYDYSYTYPGFNKVMQAVGRVIRSPDDSGFALLIDTRYGGATYRCLFPPHWFFGG